MYKISFYLTQRGDYPVKDFVLRYERGDYVGYSLRTLEKVALATGTHLNIQFKT